MSSRERPLSPHLQIYRPQLTSIMSISHRVTGIGLTFGIVALVIWLVMIVMDAPYYNDYRALWIHPFGRFMLMGISFSYAFHFCNGIRHLIWDSGHGYDLKFVYKGGYIALAVTAVMTLIMWTIIFTG